MFSSSIGRMCCHNINVMHSDTAWPVAYCSCVVLHDHAISLFIRCSRACTSPASVKGADSRTKRSLIALIREPEHLFRCSENNETTCSCYQCAEQTRQPCLCRWHQNCHMRRLCATLAGIVDRYDWITMNEVAAWQSEQLGFGLGNTSNSLCSDKSRHAGLANLDICVQVNIGMFAPSTGKIDDRWQQFMQFQIKRARQYFGQAEAGVDFLDKNARWPVW